MAPGVQVLTPREDNDGNPLPPTWCEVLAHDKQGRLRPEEDSIESRVSLTQLQKLWNDGHDEVVRSAPTSQRRRPQAAKVGIIKREVRYGLAIIQVKAEPGKETEPDVATEPEAATEANITSSRSCPRSRGRAARSLQPTDGRRCQPRRQLHSEVRNGASARASVLGCQRGQGMSKGAKTWRWHDVSKPPPGQ